MGCEQLLEAEDMSALLYRDLSEFDCLFNISSLLLATGYLDSGQFDQRFSSPRRMENFANANRVGMKCQVLTHYFA
jgi:hypothetical protein